MLTPTLRLLELLELLQGRPLTTGAEIADRLGVERRTVRRYIAVLKELGIPIEGSAASAEATAFGLDSGYPRSC
jgi:predicted DNA-binding transcriptional regulator YafY